MAKKLVATKKGAKKRVKKNIDRGQAHIQSSFNNTIVTIKQSVYEALSTKDNNTLYLITES